MFDLYFTVCLFFLPLHILLFIVFIFPENLSHHLSSFSVVPMCHVRHDVHFPAPHLASGPPIGCCSSPQVPARRASPACCGPLTRTPHAATQRTRRALAFIFNLAGHILYLFSSLKVNKNKFRDFLRTLVFPPANQRRRVTVTGVMSRGSPSVIAAERGLLITPVTATCGHLPTSGRKPRCLPFPGQEQAPRTLLTDTCHVCSLWACQMSAHGGSGSFLDG